MLECGDKALPAYPGLPAGSSLWSVPFPSQFGNFAAEKTNNCEENLFINAQNGLTIILKMNIKI